MVVSHLKAINKMLKEEWQQELVELAEAQGSAALWKGKDYSAKPLSNTCGIHGRQ